MTRSAPPAAQLSRSKLPAQMPLSSCHASERPSGDQVGLKKLPFGPSTSHRGSTELAGGGAFSL